MLLVPVDSSLHDTQHEDTVLYFQSRAKMEGVSGGTLLEPSYTTTIYLHFQLSPQLERDWCTCEVHDRREAYSLQ